MSTFITRLDAEGAGPRLAVKDLIDVEGVPTTAGCRALADRAQPAPADAPLLRGARAAGARIVGKVNLHELAFGATGINPWFGTPTNPLDPARIPGGSSSGSAVAVATDEADVALGSDTGGSVRIPSACCGTVGLKTTFGRIPLDGVWPLAHSLDTVGPMAVDVARVVLGMQLLEPGFEVSTTVPSTVARVRGLAASPEVDAAIDAALLAAELEVLDVELPGWSAAYDACILVLIGEAWQHDQELHRSQPEGIGGDVAAALAFGSTLGPDQVAEALALRTAWRAELAEALSRAELLALPTLPATAPLLGDTSVALASLTAPINLAGLPALSMPVPGGGPLPASLQLVAADGGEEQLLAAGARIEQAVR